MDADEVLRSLANVNATTDVQHRPIGGTTYVYQWSDNSKKDDWRADGYHWRQVGSAKSMKSSSTDLNKFYFQVCLYARHHQEITFKCTCI